jgi:pullulanase/glycogen debranching enzyme
VTWLNDLGTPLAEHEWQSPALRVLGMQVNAEDATPLLIYVNANAAAAVCTLPGDVVWSRVLDSSAPDADVQVASSPLVVQGGSLVVLSGPAR